MKNYLFSFILFMALAMPINTYADMEWKDISATYLVNGEWKDITTKRLYKEGLPEGWYEENGATFYIKNGNVVTSLQNIDGKECLFREDGSWVSNDSSEYLQYFELLQQMHNAKNSMNPDWVVDASGISHYERCNLLYNYCKEYMPGINDIAYAGFKFENNTLIVDLENPDISLERKISDFYSKFSGIENMGEEEKIKKIHDVIVSTFDYDYSLTNYSDSLKDAFDNNNKIVCGGYAGIFLQVCDYYGIEAEVLTGYGNREYHAWNRVKVDEKWKYVDCCWDDTEGSNAWLLKSQKDFSYTHIQDN